MSKDSPQRAILVVLLTAVICSSLVSAAVVVLRPIQLENQMLERSLNIMKLTDLLPPDREVGEDEMLELYKSLDLRIINIDTAGNDLRTLLGNTDGVVFVDIRRARTDNTKRANLLYGDLLGEIVGALMPTKETSSFTQYDCIITPAKIDNGIVTLEPNAFVQTDKLRVAAKSRINLGTEGLDVAIQTTPRRGVGSSAGQLINPFIKITGTLAKPRLSIDEQGVIFKGGAAVATGGLSLVATGLWDRIKRSDDACGESAKAGRESLHDRFPTSLTNDQ